MAVRNMGKLVYMKTIIAIFNDLLAVVTALLIAYWIRFRSGIIRPSFGDGDLAIYAKAIAIIAPLCIIMMLLFRVYNETIAAPCRIHVILLKKWLLSTVAVILVFYFTMMGVHLSRLFVALSLICLAPMLFIAIVGGRAIAMRTVGRVGRAEKKEGTQVTHQGVPIKKAISHQLDSYNR